MGSGNKTICSHCQKPGHSEQNCWLKHPEKRPVGCTGPGTGVGSRKRGEDRTCYTCGETGHISPHCPRKIASSNSEPVTTEESINSLFIGYTGQLKDEGQYKECEDCTAQQLCKWCADFGGLPSTRLKRKIMNN